MRENERVTINGKEVTLYREVETNLYRFSKDAVDMLLEALEEREQYRAIGTIEEFKALKEKSVAKKVTDDGCWDKCPTCGSIHLMEINDLGSVLKRYNYCPDCGQKLDR